MAWLLLLRDVEMTAARQCLYHGPPYKCDGERTERAIKPLVSESNTLVVESQEWLHFVYITCRGLGSQKQEAQEKYPVLTEQSQMLSEYQ